MARPTGDGVNAVALETDGEAVLQLLGSAQLDYSQPLQELLRSANAAAATGDRFAPDPVIIEADHVLMQIFVEAVRQLISNANIDRKTAVIAGFMGHVLVGVTPTQPARLLGDAALLAAGIDVPVAAGFLCAAGEVVAAEQIALAAAKKLMRRTVDVPGLKTVPSESDAISIFQPQTPWAAH